MNLLAVAKEDHSRVEPTEERINVQMLDGKQVLLPVYKIRIDQLYYNDKNARIASWVSKYKKDHNISDFDMSNHESYNTIIEDFIVKSDEEALKKTQKSIAKFGQQVQGVVLKDGRIIDGNRRFTCLRRIQRETGKTQMFSACIVEYDIEADAKAIKEMELMLQIGKESPVDYDPIERLQDIYTTVLENKLLTKKEYAERCGLSTSAMNKYIEKANILVKFLEFIGAPKDFYIARELKFDGPLTEIAGLVANKNEERQAELMDIAFTNFLAEPDGDMTRFIRKFKKIATSDKADAFIEEEQQYVEDVLAACSGMNPIESIKKIRKDDYLKDHLKKTGEKYSLLAGRAGALDSLVLNSEDALDRLNEIDSDLFTKLSAEQFDIVVKNIGDIIDKAETLKRELDAARA